MATTDPTTRSPSRWRALEEPDHQLPPAGTEPTESRTGIAELLRDLADDTRTLVRQEVQLAKLEAGRTAKRFAFNGAWIGVGAAILALGGICLVLALALGLGALLDSYWLGTLITGLVLFMVGGGFAWKGISDLKKGKLKPTQTMESLRGDAAWARREMQDIKQELSKESENG